MPIQKSEKITVSVQLLPGRDDSILELKEQAGINISDILREGAKMWIRHYSGQKSFENEVLDSLDQIKALLSQGGRVVSPMASKAKFGNSFLDSSP